LPPGALFELKIHQNAFMAGLHPAPTGEAYSTPRPVAGSQGAALRQGRGGEGEKGRVAFHHFFFTI